MEAAKKTLAALTMSERSILAGRSFGRASLRAGRTLYSGAVIPDVDTSRT